MCRQKIFQRKDEILQNVSKQLAEINIDEIFQHAEKEISFQLEQVRTALQPIDSTLVAAMENAHSKIVFQLNTMKERANASTQKKYQTGLSQIEKAFHSFLPNDNWQERELNSMYFLNKYGMNFLEKIQNELAPFIFHHQLIEL